MNYKTLNEVASNAILRTNYMVTPYKWNQFKALVSPELPKNMLFLMDGDDELLISGNFIVARYDSDELLLRTDIAKRDFNLALLGNDISHLKKYLK